MRIGLLLAMILAFWPSFVWYVRRITDGSDEPWGIVVLAVGIFLLWKKREVLKITNQGIVAASGVLLLYIFSYGFLPPMLRAMLGLLCFALLTRSLFTIPAVWGVFALSLPVIASLQFYMGYPMRVVAAVSAESVLRFGGLEVSRQGTDLFQNGKVVGVDPPCSGIEMLWVGLVIVSAFAAWMNWRFIGTSLALLGGTLGLVLGNSLRVTMLYFKESGMVNLPEWTHQGIGIAIFGVLVFFCNGRQGKLLVDQIGGCIAHQKIVALGVVTAVVAGFAPLISQSGTSIMTAHQETFPGWPDRWEGRYLEAQALSEMEENFARRFPGKLAVFSTGPEKVIFRWVTKPTRLLHSSADCLKAAGFQIEKERSGKFIAEGPNGGIFLVEEKLFNEHQSWAEVSQWYWQATFKKTSGPWWAVTVIRPWISGDSS